MIQVQRTSMHQNPATLVEHFGKPRFIVRFLTSVQVGMLLAVEFAEVEWRIQEDEGRGATLLGLEILECLAANNGTSNGFPPEPPDCLDCFRSRIEAHRLSPLRNPIPGPYKLPEKGSWFLKSHCPGHCLPSKAQAGIPPPVHSGFI